MSQEQNQATLDGAERSNMMEQLVLLTAEPLIFALFAVWYQEKIGKI